MSKDNTSIEHKKLSNRSKNLLRELERITEKAGTVIPQLYESLTSDGYNPFEAREIIEERVKISQQYLRRLLPDEAKYIERRHTGDEKLVSHTAEQPAIPPPKHTIKDASVIMHGETIQDAEHMEFRRQIKADPPFTEEERQRVNEIMTTPTFEYVSDITLDCNKFRSELRMGTLNNAKLRLQVKNNEVVKIT